MAPTEPTPVPQKPVPQKPVPQTPVQQAPVQPITVLVLNGPNLGMLGAREPEIYGAATLADIQAACTALGAELGLQIDLRQTDSEAELIGWVHEAFERRLPVVINPAGFPHYSYALR